MAQTHMVGLRQMLELRGGISAVRQTNPTIANIIFCMFIASVDEPFPATDIAYEIPRPQWFMDELLSMDNTYHIDFQAHGVQAEYEPLMQNIRFLAKTHQTAADCRSAAEYQAVLTFLCSTLQRLLSLPLPYTYDLSNLESQFVTEGCRQALIVHVFAQWCGHQPDPSLMVSVARHDLQKACRKLLITSVQNPLLLWFLAVGGVSAFGTPERKWFVGQIAALVQDFNLQGYRQFRECLRRVIWHELQDDPTHRVLWEEVKAMLEVVAVTSQTPID